MPYALPFVKVNIEGHFGTSGTVPISKWVTGFHIAKNGGMTATPSELLAFFTAINPLVDTFHKSGTLQNGANNYYTGISGALIGTDGKYALGTLQPTTRYTRPTASVGVGVGTLPWSSAICLTLRSLLLRGPASHGRMYYPSNVQGVGNTTGVILPGVVTSFVTAAQTMLNGINTAAISQFGANTYVQLVSNKGSGFQSPVTQVGVGQKYDHMESRESDLVEAHVFLPLTITTALTRERDEEIGRQLDDLFPKDE